MENNEEIETKLSEHELIEDAQKVKALAQSLREECKKIITMETPKEFIRERKGRGGLIFKYVEVGYVTLVLNNLFRNKWSFEIVDKQRDGDHIIVLGKLTIPYRGEDIVKMQFGGSEVKYTTGMDGKRIPIDIADDYKSAASDALKKCASELGIAFDLYHPKVKEVINKFLKSLTNIDK